MTKQKQISCMGLMLIFPTLPHRLSISRRGSRCVMVEVSQGDCDALVMRGYLAKMSAADPPHSKRRLRAYSLGKTYRGPLSPKRHKAKRCRPSVTLTAKPYGLADRKIICCDTALGLSFTTEQHPHVQNARL
jgi:hypothetical protein